MVMSTIVLHSPLNILETVRDRGSVHVKSFFTELRIYTIELVYVRWMRVLCFKHTVRSVLYYCPACPPVILVDCVDPVVNFNQYYSKFSALILLM